ncbi:MAG: ABC transporter ATP-binding protein [Flavobacteriaceae bacterium]|nr:ABC transporter ATP-binding protein [Flavobacteriaceae bacterium]|tara:strand:+ start:469 stop:1125 length:657 start_codon:yes stop_codon:yes gene_type:complete
MLKAVIFDMDGVIVDSEPLHRKAYQRMFFDFELEVSNELYGSFTGQSTQAICEILCNLFNLNYKAELLVNRKRKHFELLFDEDDELNLIEGVLDLIKDYYKSGLNLILASSASMQNINRIFKRFDLDSYFKCKLSGADLKASKPDPEIFIKATEASGFLKENCLVIEDSTNGISAAKSAGLFCVGFNSANSKNQNYTDADMIIESFKEIKYSKIITKF